MGTATTLELVCRQGFPSARYCRVTGYVCHLEAKLGCFMHASEVGDYDGSVTAATVLLHGRVRGAQGTWVELLLHDAHDSHEKLVRLKRGPANQNQSTASQDNGIRLSTCEPKPRGKSSDDRAMMAVANRTAFQGMHCLSVDCVTPSEHAASERAPTPLASHGETVVGHSQASWCGIEAWKLRREDCQAGEGGMGIEEASRSKRGEAVAGARALSDVVAASKGKGGDDDDDDDDAVVLESVSCHDEGSGDDDDLLFISTYCVSL